MQIAAFRCRIKMAKKGIRRLRMKKSKAWIFLIALVVVILLFCVSVIKTTIYNQIGRAHV